MGPLGWRWGRFSHAINLNAFCRLMEMNLVVAMGSYLVKTTMGRHTNDTPDTRRHVQRFTCNTAREVKCDAHASCRASSQKPGCVKLRETEQPSTDYSLTLNPSGIISNIL
ncbi:hypothetical protein ACLKA6_011389 [Drosophila palustris]